MARPITFDMLFTEFTFALSIIGIEVTITTSPSSLVVGQSVTFHCTSDLDLIGIDWYRGDTRVATSTSQIETTLNPVSTNDEGMEYKCKARSPYGTQERSFILHTRGIYISCMM